ncbi:MAG: hypothetical protein H0X01_00600 [Nitrospira sp.]|nr:hypothetical protein [Nitrospira sp.]
MDIGRAKTTGKLSRELQDQLRDVLTEAYELGRREGFRSAEKVIAARLQIALQAPQNKIPRPGMSRNGGEG